MAKKSTSEQQYVSVQLPKRRTKRNPDKKKDYTIRLNRIEGQLNGIKKMVEDDRYVDDILIQLSAVHMSVKSFANIILEDYIHSNVVNDLKQDKLDTIEEVVEMFKRFQ